MPFDSFLRPFPAARTTYVPRHLREIVTEPTSPSVAGQRALAIVVGGSLLAAAAGPAAASTHSVQEGETLSEIAEGAGLSVSALISMNGLSNPDVIFVGQQLSLLAGNTTTTTSSSDSGTPPHDHVVKPGETLSEIADDHGVSFASVLAGNPGLADRPLWVGEVVVVNYGDSSSTTTTTVVTPAPAPVAAPLELHTVVSGDSLSVIAQKYSVSLAALVSTNSLSTDSVLQVGQQIKIPRYSGGLPQNLLNSPERLALMPIFDEMATTYDVPPDLLKALAWFESGWNNTKISSADAIGIGQILPITAEFVGNNLLGKNLDPYVPRDNIELSAAFMRYLLRELDGDPRLALAAYYQGLTAVRTHGIYSSSEFYVDGILSLRERFA